MWSQSLCSHRLWSHRLLLASLTNPVPLVVSTTDRLSVSDMGTTARLLGHTTGRRFPAMSNTTGPTGRPQMMMANTARHQVAPNTIARYLVAICIGVAAIVAWQSYGIYYREGVGRRS